MNLQLSLKTRWFLMTKDGIKCEDYRSITPYWIKRLTRYNETTATTEQIIREINNLKYYGFEDVYQYLLYRNLFFKPFDYNIMTLGYPKSTDTERILKLKHKGIEIRTGNPELGAEPDKLYFVIKHGEIVK